MTQTYRYKKQYFPRRLYAAVLYFVNRLFSSGGFAAQRQPEKDAKPAGLDGQAEYILRHYGNSLLRLAYSYLHNMSDAEDVLQDTLVQFLKNMPVFKNESHQKAWLMRVACNLSKNRLSYNKRRRTDELSEALAEESPEDLSFVWDAVKALPQAQREVIHLFYHEGYSTAQIAEILGKNESTVRSALHRGRNRLKKQLKEAYDFDETV